MVTRWMVLDSTSVECTNVEIKGKKRKEIRNSRLRLRQRQRQTDTEKECLCVWMRSKCEKMEKEIRTHSSMYCVSSSLHSAHRLWFCLFCLGKKRESEARVQSCRNDLHNNIWWRRSFISLAFTFVQIVRVFFSLSFSVLLFQSFCILPWVFHNSFLFVLWIMRWQCIIGFVYLSPFCFNSKSIYHAAHNLLSRLSHRRLHCHRHHHHHHNQHSNKYQPRQRIKNYHFFGWLTG